MTTRPNILVIMTDQQRRETVGTAPDAWIATPNLERLVRDGTDFRRAYAPCPICVPARFTLLTGLHANRAHAIPVPGTETVLHPLDNGGNVPDPGRTLPSLLRKNGYRTAIIGKTHMMPYYCPLGFDHTQLMEMDPDDDYSRYLNAHGYDIADQKVDLGARGLRAHTSPVPLEHYPTTWVTRETVNFIRSRQMESDPFFLWCSFLRPHNPYNPPPPYHGSIDPQSLPLPTCGETEQSGKPEFYRARARYLGYDKMTESETRESRARYCEAVRLIDDCVGNIIDTLQESGQWENTAVLFTSDHGDLLGDHGLWHKTSAYEGSAGVPLLLRAPGHCRTGRTDRLASLVDLAPTCLDLAGIPIPDKYDGRSLLDIDRPDTPEWRHSALIECGYYPSTLTAIVTDRWKYCHHMNGGFEELYDFQDDPDELVNLAARPEAQSHRERMRTALIELIRREGAPWYLENSDLRQIPYDPEYNTYTGRRRPLPEIERNFYPEPGQ